MATPDGPNAEQISYWNEQAGPKWVALQDRLDAQLEPFGLLVVDRLALQPGERVLDVGCGCGATTRELAARVAPGGAAVGADVSGPMLAHARRLAAAEGGPQPMFVHEDASRYHPDQPFDAIASRFGVMFFAEPQAAFTHLRDVLRPGGRLAFICWRVFKENPWVLVPLMAAAEIVPLEPPPAPHAPGPFAFADADYVRDVLGGAGFADVVLDPVDRVLSIGGGADLDEAARFLVQMGPTARLLKDADDEVRARVAAAVRDAIAPYQGAAGVSLRSASWLVSARRP